MRSRNVESERRALDSRSTRSSPIVSSAFVLHVYWPSSVILAFLMTTRRLRPSDKISRLQETFHSQIVNKIKKRRKLLCCKLATREGEQWFIVRNAYFVRRYHKRSIGSVTLDKADRYQHQYIRIKKAKRVSHFAKPIVYLSANQNKDYEQELNLCTRKCLGYRNACAARAYTRGGQAALFAC